MQELFVPYELAVKLKELGFEEECLAFYARRHSGEFHLWFPLEWEFKDTQAYSLESSCPAPLWQQAFDYFRLKHKIRGWVSPVLSMVLNPPEDYHYTIWGLGRKIDDILRDEDPKIKSYEESRQACLGKLIELISK